jgi:hypothetical protein
MSRPTIAELEYILNHEEDAPITILSDGSVVASDDSDDGWKHFGLEKPKRKPLTFRENLGGEYAA